MVGYGFMAHGCAQTGEGTGAFCRDTAGQGLGVSMAELMGWAIIVVELLGGLAVLMGAFMPVVSVPLGAILPVTMFAV